MVKASSRASSEADFKDDSEAGSKALDGDFISDK
jgi:hypothetical protein